MSAEEDLKSLILRKYGSVRNFSIVIGMPYSTVDSIFKRGINNSSVTNIIKICQALSISADSLAIGKIEYLSAAAGGSRSPESRLIDNFQSLNMEGQEELIKYSEYLMSRTEYKKFNKSDVVQKEA